MIPVWDIWIRLFHWSLVLAVLFLLFSGETSIGFFEWHRQAGEFVLALIAFRLIWGVVGSSNARLSQLFAPPRQSIHHLTELAKGRAEQERGHNAAGGWAVLLMLALIGFQAASGLFIADEDELMEGSFYGALGSDTTALLYRLHKLNAELIQVVISIHVLMVIIYLTYAKQNLVIPMITGKMKWLQTSTPPPLHIRHWATGLFLLAMLSVIFGLVFR